MGSYNSNTFQVSTNHFYVVRDRKCERCLKGFKVGDVVVKKNGFSKGRVSKRRYWHRSCYEELYY